MKPKTNLSLSALIEGIQKLPKHILPYLNVLIFCMFALAYGFLVLRINQLSNPPVSENAVSSDVKSIPVPRIDEQAAKQLQNLKDNSVNVQSLFEQSRTNPFQE